MDKETQAELTEEQLDQLVDTDPLALLQHASRLLRETQVLRGLLHEAWLACHDNYNCVDNVDGLAERVHLAVGWEYLETPAVLRHRPDANRILCQLPKGGDWEPLADPYWDNCVIPVRFRVVSS